MPTEVRMRLTLYRYQYTGLSHLYAYCIFPFNSYSASHDNWCTATLWNRIMTAQCEGMGEVGSARYDPALLPPCPSIRVLSYSNYQEIHSRQQTGLAVQVLTGAQMNAWSWMSARSKLTVFQMSAKKNESQMSTGAQRSLKLMTAGAHSGKYGILF